ncbi:hypothetical protein CRE_28122 [Caenorhabditis remanei]|uniref:Ig-like domain-containing protein n=1 Tax=Caenorhabditis remanei TaxID=31234 RepID=E3LMF3_CAERE|nr:hypothetical protein CRE_28122 [Caenorhabditis remanei]
MRDHQKTEHHHETKTFEDVAFEMLSTVSPVKLPREDIPFDSVRKIILNEVTKRRNKNSKPSTSARANMDELLEDGPSSSSSSSHVGESSSSILDRGTMTDDGETGTPRPIAARLYGDCPRSSSSSTSSAAPCGSSDGTDAKKKPLNYREKRIAEARAGRMKKYRENTEIVEFKCEENGLKEEFLKFYAELLEDDSDPANVYYRIVESLDFYFRAKTWESNCPKLLCEFLCETILKTCQELNESHETSNATDERKSREIQIQVLLTLHVFVVTNEQRWLDESINKMRMIFISVGAEKLRAFVEEPVTDIFLELIRDDLATIYDELCINLPADLVQYNIGLFKMTEADDNFVVKRRNGAANRLEQMLIETSDNLGIGGVEKTTRATSEAPVKRKSLKRKTDEVPKELLSPARPTRAAAAGRPDYKQFFVEDTPDEKYYKKKASKKKELEDEEEEEEEEEEEDDDNDEEIEVTYHSRKKRITIKEEIDEEVKQTPMAKLRAAAASKNGKRCSRRLSELVKLSEERSQIPKKARENLNRILEKAKTPLRSIIRPTRKSVLFGATTTSSSAGMNTRGSNSRASLLTRFSDAGDRRSPGEELTVDTSGGHDINTPSSASESSTPTLRERSMRKRPARFRGDSFTDQGGRNIKVKQEEEDPELDFPETTSSSLSKRTSKTTSASSSAATTPSKWTDRQLKRQLGLTREDLNRYRAAMLTTGERNRNKNVKINWESAQVNRAGRVKGAGASEDGTPIFGIMRRNVRTMICHVLLNDTNPDTSFNWNKVKFDDFEKPRTRQLQSLIQKPEAYMESLKQKYIEKKAMPLKRMRSNAAAAASVTISEESTSTSEPSGKRKCLASSSSTRRTTRIAMSKTVASSSSSFSIRSEKSPDEFDEYGFESEADD